MLLNEFIQALPKAELHLHLEGAIPWEMVRASSAGPLPHVPPWWAGDFVFDDFATGFTDAVRLCYRPVLTGVERFHQAARTIFARLAEQNVRYAEISFTPRFCLDQGFPTPEVVSAIRDAAPQGLAVAVYAGLARDARHRLDDSLIQAILDAPDLAGLDLYGDERKGEAAPFADFFAQAGARGLRLKAHAGELDGPTSLVERLRDEEITLDVCPTSNVKLRVVEKIGAHPIQMLHQRGVRVTVNTDDPTIFGCSLNGELALLVRELGFTLDDLAQLEMNAFRAADLPDAVRDAVMNEVRTLARGVDGSFG